MTTVAIIQARVGSTRLPGKVMRNIKGRSVLSHVIERVSACTELDEIIVATTINKNDDVIANEAIFCNSSVYRGNENDVLDRYAEAAKSTNADTVVRITSDCPMFDPLLLSEMISRYYSLKNIDYLSNTLVRSYPRGLDAEIFSREILDVTAKEADQPYQREHVTPFIYENPNKFQLFSYERKENLSHFRWTLDVIEDWEFIEKIYSDLWSKNALFTTDDVLNLIQKKPELLLINAHVEQTALLPSRKCGEDSDLQD